MSGPESGMEDEGPPRIRTAALDDVPRLASLTAILGYDVPEAHLRPRVARLLARTDAVLYVADTRRGVAGWILGGEQETLETGPRCEILGLVVDPSGRRAGVGRHLVDAIEAWARQRGLPSVMVRSNVVRQESHPFYERLGFSRRKTQHVYVKPV